MRRVLTWSAVAVALLAGAVVALLVFLSTPSGQSTISSVLSALSGGDLSIDGLSARVSGELRIRELTVRDKNGPWLTAENLHIQGSFLRLIHEDVEVQSITASRVRVIRLPVSDNSTFSLPHIHVARADLPDVETGKALTGTPMRFSGAGTLDILSLDDIAGDVRLTRRDGVGSYSANGRFRDGAANGVITIDEPAAGLVTGLLGLNAIGPIRAEIRAAGSPAANKFSFAVNAGAFTARGNGLAQIAARTIDADFSAAAPAMQLRPDLSWQALSAEGHAHGPIDALSLDGRFRIAELHAGKVSATMLAGSAIGNSGTADFTATASGVSVPGIDARLLSGAPVQLRAHTQLNAPHRPVDFSIAHPLLAATGTGQLDGTGAITANLRFPKLQPIASLADIPMEGNATLAARILIARSGMSINVDGKVSASGGDPMITRAIGSNAAVTAAADLNGETISNLKLGFRGARVNANISGGLRNRALDVTASGTVQDVSLFVPGVSGKASFNTTVAGAFDSLKLSGTLSGMLATQTLEPRRVSVKFDAAGAPKNGAGSFAGEAPFRDAPVSVAGTFDWHIDALRVSVAEGRWKSLLLSGNAEISKADAIHGAASVRVDHLTDLEPWLGMPVSGSADAQLDFQQRGEKSNLAIKATGHDMALQDAQVASLTADGDIANPFTTPQLAVKLDASGIAAQGVSGTATAALSGTLRELGVTATGDLRDANQRALKLSAKAMLHNDRKQAQLTALTVDYRDVRADLSEPATISFANAEVDVERLILRSGGANLVIKGRLTHALVVDASLEGVSAAMLRPFIPTLSEASLAGTAHLTGTLAAPQGSITLTGRGLRMQGVPGDVAPGVLNARADLRSGGVQIDSTLAIGSSKLAVSGTAPLTPNGRFDLKATGTADLSLFNGDLTATGRRLLGQAIVDGVVRGTLAAPDISGGAKLTNVEFHDSANGVRLTSISGEAAFRGSTVEIVDLSGRAGAGTVRLNGSINLAAAGVPVQLVVTARNAEPVSSDQFTARIDADVTVTGTIAGGLKAGGKIAVLRAESVLPNSLPPEVANLDVKRPGKPVAPPAPQVRPSTIALDLNVTSPGQFFLRGRGLDTELSGDVHVGGTVSAQVITGAFEMRRGTFDLGGTTLNFTSGKVTFETGSLRNRIDPTIDFVAQSSTGGYAAKLEISGTVSNPKVQLSSTPTLPQDEILAQVLFQQNVKQLSALQLAQMAQAAASLGGLSGGFDPIGSARRVLGLDRLSVGTGPNNQTQVEAGKYVLRNVYVGAKQGLSNAPQAEVQVDLTKHLKAKATIATGNNSAAVTQGAQQQDPGTSAGLSWQFEY